MVVHYKSIHVYGRLISGCIHGFQLFIGGLDLIVTDEDLKEAFSLNFRIFVQNHIMVALFNHVSLLSVF